MDKKQKYLNTLDGINRTKKQSPNFPEQEASRLYSKFVYSTVGKPSHYNIGIGKVRMLFTKVIKICSELKISVWLYFEIMFMTPETEARNHWEYPPLNYLGTDAAKELFIWRHERLQKRIMAASPADVSNYVALISRLNYEKHFQDCFTSGYYELEKLFKAFKGLDSEFTWLDVLGVFYNYGVETFKPYYVVLSKAFNEGKKLKGIKETILIESDEMNEVLSWVYDITNPLGKELSNKIFKSKMQLAFENRKNAEREVLIKRGGFSQEIFKWLE